VSATLLRLAARGEHAELTADLACALVGGDAAAARTAATSLFGHGATSGRDTAAGALLGCRVWLGERGTIAPVRTEHAA
jgi:hypothetical protein